MKMSVVIISSMVIIILCLSLLQVVVSNSIATTGIELGKLEQQVDSYKLSNIQLSEKLLSLSSYTYIASRSSELGYETGGRKTALHLTPLPVAYSR